MSQERFDALLERLARQLKLEPLAHLLQTGFLNLDGTDVHIGYVPDRHCRVMVDFGPVHGQADAGYYRRMLELNLAAAPGCWPVLSLHPESRHVVAILDVALEELEGEDALLQLLCSRIPSWIDAWHDDLTGPMAQYAGDRCRPEAVA